MTDDEKYPLHEKLYALSSQRDTAQEFYDWLIGEGYVLARWSEIKFYGESELTMSLTPPDEILGGFFEIDLKKLEAEKKAMLKELTEAVTRVTHD